MFSQQLHVTNLFGVIWLLTLPRCDVQAQGWQWQNPLPQGNNLNAVSFVDSVYGWFASGGSLVVHTNDGGETWQMQYLDYDTGLNDIQFLDRYNGWAVGWRFVGPDTDKTAIFHTTNSGQTWQSVPHPQIRFAVATTVFFLDSLRGWVGTNKSRVLRTIDGGKTWSVSRVHPINVYRISDIYFIDAHEGWAVSDALISHTTDGGETWTTPDSLPFIAANSVYFRNKQLGWILNGSIWQTQDGGHTWQQQWDWMPLNLPAFSITFLNSLHGWATSITSVLGTTDGGMNWKVLNDSIGGTRTQFVTLKKGWTAQMRYTNDGGRTWEKKTRSVTGKEIFDFFAVNRQHGWAVASDRFASEILHTNDGGTTWIIQATIPGNELRGVNFADAKTGWVIGGGGLIMHTNDSGRNWTTQSSGTTEGLAKVFSISPDECWIVGSGGTILHTKDGGTTWGRQNSGVTNLLGSVYFINSKEGWVAGEIGLVLHTKDGGQNWEIQPTGTRDGLGEISFVDSLYGWVGGGRTVLHTQDGGKTWESQEVNIWNGIHGIDFVDRQHGWSAGGSGAIRATTDGGKTWLPQNSTTFGTIWEIQFVDRWTGWAVGSHGILHTSTGGTVTSVYDPISHTSFSPTFRLFQNYPNPFNPVTVIEFEITQPDVTFNLEIFDVLGRKIKAWQGQARQARIYRFLWDGKEEQNNAASSGLYFYQLKVGEARQIKKMLLLH